MAFDFESGKAFGTLRIFSWARADLPISSMLWRSIVWQGRSSLQCSRTCRLLICELYGPGPDGKRSCCFSLAFIASFRFAGGAARCGCRSFFERNRFIEGVRFLWLKLTDLRIQNPVQRKASPQRRLRCNPRHPLESQVVACPIRPPDSSMRLLCWTPRQALAAPMEWSTRPR